MIMYYSVPPRMADCLSSLSYLIIFQERFSWNVVKRNMHPFIHRLVLVPGQQLEQGQPGIFPQSPLYALLRGFRGFSRTDEIITVLVRWKVRPGVGSMLVDLCQRFDVSRLRSIDWFTGLGATSWVIFSQIYNNCNKLILAYIFASSWPHVFITILLYGLISSTYIYTGFFLKGVNS